MVQRLESATPPATQAAPGDQEVRASQALRDYADAVGVELPQLPPAEFAALGELTEKTDDRSRRHVELYIEWCLNSAPPTLANGTSAEELGSILDLMGQARAMYGSAAYREFDAPVAAALRAYHAQVSSREFFSKVNGKVNSAPLESFEKTLHVYLGSLFVKLPANARANGFEQQAERAAKQLEADYYADRSSASRDAGSPLDRRLREMSSLAQQDSRAVDAALALVPEDVITGLRQRVSTQDVPAYRHVKQILESRYSTVMGIQIEAEPQFRAAVAGVVRTMLSYRPEIAKRLSQASVRVIVNPWELPVRMNPDNYSLFRPKWRLEHELLLAGGNFNPDSGAVVVSATFIFSGSSPCIKPGIPIHELAHAIHLTGMSAEEQRRVEKAFAVEGKLPGYIGTNEREFFAEMSALYFSGEAAGGSERFTREQMGQQFPLIYSVLVDIYGPEASRLAPTPLDISATGR